MTAAGTPADKVHLRRTLLARRQELSTQELDRAGHRLADAVAPLAADAVCVAAYASLGSEPPTTSLLELLSADGRPVLLPVLQDDGDLDWSPWQGQLVAGRRGTQVPPGPPLGRDALASCDLVVVPALAVDRRGVRLGRGGGAYDRALRRARGLVVALLHDGELVAALPEQGHDVRVHAAATPGDGVVRLPARMPP